MIRLTICRGPNTRLCRESWYTLSFPYTSPSFRANIHQGARVEPTTLTRSERERIEAFAPILAARGLELAGFDFIGEYVTEINVTSPSALRQINQVMGERLERRVVDWLEERAARGAGVEA